MSFHVIVFRWTGTVFASPPNTTDKPSVWLMFLCDKIKSYYPWRNLPLWVAGLFGGHKPRPFKWSQCWGQIPLNDEAFEMIYCIQYTHNCGHISGNLYQHRHCKTPVPIMWNVAGQWLVSACWWVALGFMMTVISSLQCQVQGLPPERGAMCSYFDSTFQYDRRLVTQDYQ